ncbi:zinc-binding dehydrogenase [Streptosporangium sp. NPDC051023]|uniref:zinc-binding dehydrogenase n=1 Tax=Streptosporangium sp. NPDC051023 TaxID=3155410 RepID=UPI00344C33EC
MRAVRHAAHGGPEVLEAVELPDPVAGPGEVLIAVEAVALNRLDVLQRRGPGLLPGFALPHVPGMDVAGVVVDVGPRATGSGTPAASNGSTDVNGVNGSGTPAASNGSNGVNGSGTPAGSPGRPDGQAPPPLAVGDRVVVDPALHCGSCTACAAGDSVYCAAMRVVGGSRQGGYAELVAVPATHTHPVPPHVGPLEAASLPTAYSMAWQALVVRGGLRAGETLLVHGAGSAITVAAVQIARGLGARTVVTSGSEEKLRRMTKIGADAVLDHRVTDVAAATRELTGGQGADIVLDHVGPALFQASLDALRRRGRLVFCGNTTGMTAQFNLVDAYQRALTIIGSESYGHATFGEMLRWYWESGGEPVIDSVFPLEEAADAHRRLESGDACGKILLTP